MRIEQEHLHKTIKIQGHLAKVIGIYGSYIWVCYEGTSSHEYHTTHKREGDYVLVKPGKKPSEELDEHLPGTTSYFIALGKILDEMEKR